MVLLYKVLYFIGNAGTGRTDNLTCEIIYDNFTCENYRFSNNHTFWIFYIGRKDCSLYKQKKYMGAWKYHMMFMLNMIFLNMISCSTLEISLVFPSTYALFSVYLVHI